MLLWHARMEELHAPTYVGQTANKGWRTSIQPAYSGEPIHEGWFLAHGDPWGVASPTLLNVNVICEP